MTIEIGRAWLCVDWDRGRRYLEIYRNDRTLVVTLGPFGFMAGLSD